MNPEKTLEKESNINLTSFDTQHEVDPLFKQMTQKFDEMGQSSLMTSTLDVTPGLLIQLDGALSVRGMQRDLVSEEKMSTEGSTENQHNLELVGGYLKNMVKFDMGKIY